MNFVFPSICSIRAHMRIHVLFCFAFKRFRCFLLFGIESKRFSGLLARGGEALLLSWQHLHESRFGFAIVCSTLRLDRGKQHIEFNIFARSSRCLWEKTAISICYRIRKFHLSVSFNILDRPGKDFLLLVLLFSRSIKLVAMKSRKACLGSCRCRPIACAHFRDAHRWRKYFCNSQSK